jgi:ribonuclease HI
VLAKTSWSASLCFVEVCEALELCEALQWVVELGLNIMDFSLDSKLVVDFVNSNNSSNTNFKSIISHCRQLLSS